VSAATGIGLDRLAQTVAERLGDGHLEVVVETSVGNGRLFAFLSEHAEVLKKDYQDSRVVMDVRIPQRFVGQLLNDAGTEVRNADGTPLAQPNDEDADEEEWVTNGAI